MYLFLDTEFTNFDCKTATLLSIAVLDEQDRLFYGEFEVDEESLKLSSGFVKRELLGQKELPPKWPAGLPNWPANLTTFRKGSADYLRKELVKWLEVYRGNTLHFVADVGQYDWVYTMSWLAKEHNGNSYEWGEAEGHFIRFDPIELSGYLPPTDKTRGELAKECLGESSDPVLEFCCSSAAAHLAWADAVVSRILFRAFAK